MWSRTTRQPRVPFVFPSLARFGNLSTPRMSNHDSFPTRSRHVLLAFAISVAAILYLDRVCISQTQQLGRFCVGSAVLLVVPQFDGDEQSVAPFRLQATLNGCFWKEIEQSLDPITKQAS